MQVLGDRQAVLQVPLAGLPVVRGQGDGHGLEGVLDVGVVTLVPAEDLVGGVVVDGSPSVMEHGCVSDGAVSWGLSNQGAGGWVLRLHLDALDGQGNVPGVHLTHPAQHLDRLLVCLNGCSYTLPLGGNCHQVCEAQHGGSWTRVGHIGRVLAAIQALDNAGTVCMLCHDVAKVELLAQHAGVISIAGGLQRLHPHVITLQHHNPGTLYDGRIPLS
mmetsp:Transcript_11139/g.24011  ORF Transcript_11139/g.24011 Transcript_11139/m.24011 type:complete len:216 (-) Transcript_11139:819-1466(-)